MIAAQPVLFAVLVPEQNELLVGRIKKEFPNDHFYVSARHVLVVTTGTAVDLSTKLGIIDGSAGSGIVLAVSSYYGRASTALWEWIASKMGAPNSAS